MTSLPHLAIHLARPLQASEFRYVPLKSKLSQLLSINKINSNSKIEKVKKILTHLIIE